MITIFQCNSFGLSKKPVSNGLKPIHDKLNLLFCSLLWLLNPFSKTRLKKKVEFPHFSVLWISLSLLHICTSPIYPPPENKINVDLHYYKPHFFFWIPTHLFSIQALSSFSFILFKFFSYQHQIANCLSVWTIHLHLCLVTLLSIQNKKNHSVILSKYILFQLF